MQSVQAGARREIEGGGVEIGAEALRQARREEAGGQEEEEEEGWSAGCSKESCSNLALVG